MVGRVDAGAVFVLSLVCSRRIDCAVASDEFRAVVEHATAAGDGLEIPVCACGGVDGLEAGAAVEHFSNVRYISHLEARDIELGEGVAVVEHTPHRGDVLCVELREINGGEA